MVWVWEVVRGIKIACLSVKGFESLFLEGKGGERGS